MDRPELVLFEELVQRHGSDTVMTALRRSFPSDAARQELTIIANAGVHNIPEVYLRGTVVEASRGNWDASSPAAIEREMRSRLATLVVTLKKVAWTHVYLVPTGHTVFALQVKALVYRILRINTVDLYYSHGNYFDVEIDQRALALGQLGDAAGTPP